MTGYVYRGRKRDLGIDLEALTKRMRDGDLSPVTGICGTVEGWRRHRNWLHDEPCQACKDAKAAERQVPR